MKNNTVVQLVTVFLIFGLIALLIIEGAKILKPKPINTPDRRIDSLELAIQKNNQQLKKYDSLVLLEEQKVKKLQTQLVNLNIKTEKNFKYYEKEKLINCIL